MYVKSSHQQSNSLEFEDLLKLQTLTSVQSGDTAGVGAKSEAERDQSGIRSSV